MLLDNLMKKLDEKRSALLKSAAISMNIRSFPFKKSRQPSIFRIFMKTFQSIQLKQTLGANVVSL